MQLVQHHFQCSINSVSTDKVTVGFMKRENERIFLFFETRDMTKLYLELNSL